MQSFYSWSFDLDIGCGFRFFSIFVSLLRLECFDCVYKPFFLLILVWLWIEIFQSLFLFQVECFDGFALFCSILFVRVDDMSFGCMIFSFSD